MTAVPFRRASAAALVALAAATPAAFAAPGPQVLDARVAPSPVREGHAARVRAQVTGAVSVRFVVELHRGGRLVRVWAQPAAASAGRAVATLPRGLRAGRYRVSTVALDGRGLWSRPLSRSLRVLPRR